MRKLHPINSVSPYKNVHWCGQVLWRTASQQSTYTVISLIHLAEGHGNIFISDI